MNQLTLKTVKNAWAKSLSVLDNPYVNLTLVIVLILYASKMFGNINEVINGLYQYTFVKLLVLLIIVYVAPKDTNIAILLAISYVMSLKNMNMEMFQSDFLKKIKTDTDTGVGKSTCSSIDALNTALSMYQTINNGLTNVISSLNSLNDDALSKPPKSDISKPSIISSLTTLNDKIKNSINNVNKTINNQTKDLPNGIKCPPTTPPSISPQKGTSPVTPTSTTKVSFCPIKDKNAKLTTNDNILISMSFISDNIRIFSNSSRSANDFNLLCVGIVSSINSLEESVKNYFIGSADHISDENGQAILTALNLAKTGVNDNITAAIGIVTTYVNNMITYLCNILNDTTYKTLIATISKQKPACKSDIAKQLFNLININDPLTGIKITNVQLKGINVNNILDPNAAWLKGCLKSKDVPTALVASLSSASSGIPFIARQ